MRFRFQDPANIAESSGRHQMVTKIDHWWSQFRSRTKDLEAAFEGSDDWDIVEWMGRELAAVDEEISWQFRPSALKGRHELALSPDHDPSKVWLIKQILKQAPSIPDWDFSIFRNAVGIEECVARTLETTGIDLSNSTVSVHEGNANQINFVFYFDRLPADEDVLLEATLIAVEMLLGEEEMMLWAGEFEAVDSQKPHDATMRFVPLAQVPHAVQSVKESITERLPVEPFWTRVEELQWAAFELKPSEALDYARRDDLLTAVTCDPDLAAGTFEAHAFASQRFSRSGETFCFVKVDERGSVESGFAEREDMEEAVRSTLESQELGCLVGSGTGLRYTYLELALTDLDEALNAIRETLQEGQVSRRSWVLFHDAVLGNEWFPIYEGASGPYTDE